jgi:hypothetical protein
LAPALPDRYARRDTAQGFDLIPDDFSRRQQNDSRAERQPLGTCPGPAAFGRT